MSDVGIRSSANWFVIGGHPRIVGAAGADGRAVGERIRVAGSAVNGHVIAQLVQADEDTVRDVIHKFNESLHLRASMILIDDLVQPLN
ncbi:hypothetical protein AB0C76_05300 [Kitasatospora sp. NPDC048722]|uniref:hypothetical protein n=1 Tax=Kitasatospora sp. NPDC048722 TaxID=3155639 RepID=UPI0033D277FD